MRDITILLDDDTDADLYKTTVIRQGENKASQFLITIPDDMSVYSCRLIFKLNDNETYATSSLTPVDGIVTYEVTNVLTFESGTLIMEVQFYEAVENTLIKSMIIPFLVHRCVDDVPVIIPDDYTNYVNLLDTYMSDEVYDPTGVVGDVFDMDNMVESADSKVFTATERTTLENLNTFAHAELYRYGNTVSFSVPTGATYTQIPPAVPSNQHEFENVSYDAVEHAFEIEIAGLYWTCLSFSSYSGTNEIVLDTAVFKNNVICENAHIVRKFGNATDISTGCCTALMRCEVGDKLNIKVKHDNVGSVALTVKYGNFNISKFAD